MFTDSEATPNRLEVLIDVLRDYSRKEWTRNDLAGVLQPKGLPNLTSGSSQASITLGACKELGIITEEEKLIRLAPFDRNLPTTQMLLGVLDLKVLASTDVEPFYAPFYSYLLSLDEDGGVKRNGDLWAINFARDCPSAARTQNPFNRDKYTGLNRWYCYTGHGWFDPEGVFQPNPYERIRRKLPDMFASGQDRMSGDEFFNNLGQVCPELDGGEIFCRTVASYDLRKKVVTMGVSHALVDLHLDGVIRLICEPDSRGWSIEAAHPPNDGKTLRSGRIDYVECC